eukprot:scaffold1146_cov399-Prasinococcus_capsulatus_cf.AAC.65
MRSAVSTTVATSGKVGAGCTRGRCRPRPARTHAVVTVATGVSGAMPPDTHCSNHERDVHGA